MCMVIRVSFLRIYVSVQMGETSTLAQDRDASLKLHPKELKLTGKGLTGKGPQQDISAWWCRRKSTHIFISIRLVMIVQWFRLCWGPSGSPNIEGWLGEQRVVLGARCFGLRHCVSAARTGEGAMYGTSWWKDGERTMKWMEPEVDW